MDKLMKSKEVAEALGVTAQTVREWFHEGKIAATILPSGDLRFTPGAVSAFIGSRTIKKTPKATV